MGPGEPCYLIAEIGGNFTTVEQGKRLIDLAAETGVDSVKLQTFRAETLTSKKAVFEMENTGKVSQYDLFKKYEVGRETHKALRDHAAAKGLFFFSTPSHASDADLLEGLGVQAYKIGSDDAVNLPFLRHVARKGKPVLLSTGMCTMAEVESSVKTLESEGCRDIVLFHCTTNYPTHPESVNLKAMNAMQSRFPYPVGYSDHTLGIDAAYAAAALGAAALEFHFTYDKKAAGPDHMLSKDPAETAELSAKVKKLAIMLGDGVKKPAASEAGTLRNNRKSLVLVRDVKSGEKISPENVEPKRPGYGIPCLSYDEVLGKTARRDLSRDDVLTWDDIA
ncbi:MAG: N-acetylneuraminate synthase family protein [Elusimicrobia bacterium]|nr:N-acetylneuraminate synthase family protein [Elusimicrobiota bacterium]